MSDSAELSLVTSFSRALRENHAGKGGQEFKRTCFKANPHWHQLKGNGVGQHNVINSNMTLAVTDITSTFEQNLTTQRFVE